MKVPEGLLAITDRDETWTAWLDSLPLLVDALLGEWELSVDGPAGHGRCALVLPVRTREGVPAALKLAWPARGGAA